MIKFYVDFGKTPIESIAKREIKKKYFDLTSFTGLGGAPIFFKECAVVPSSLTVNTAN